MGLVQQRFSQPNRLGHRAGSAGTVVADTWGQYRLEVQKPDLLGRVCQRTKLWKLPLMLIK